MQVNEDVITAPFSVPFIHRLRFTENAFSSKNPVLDEVLREGSAEPPLAAAFFDKAVAEAWLNLENHGSSHSAEPYCAVDGVLE